MDYYKRAIELYDEIIAHRRYLHENAEVGLDLPLAREYVSNELRNIGVDAKPCGYGITATIGNSGKVILLRADMDALPMEEESGEAFACKNCEAAHTCGHDFHAAMLLTVAKMLKENEGNLLGTVKLMFQPAEESLEGAKNMISSGVLEAPKVDAAFAVHVAAGKLPESLIMYNDTGTMMYSADMFRIHIKGKGAHGAYPHLGIDPINIGNHICLRLKTLAKRFSVGEKDCLITIGHFEAGSTGNVIPDEAILEGSVRTVDREVQEKLIREIEMNVRGIAEEFGGRADFEIVSGVPPLVCNPKLTEKFVGYIRKLEIPKLTFHKGISSTASEDFACVAAVVPGSFMYLSAGFEDERGDIPAHNPKVLFNEKVCPLGAAVLAQCATEWLSENQM